MHVCPCDFIHGGCVCVRTHVCTRAQLYPILCIPVDSSLPGSSVHEIFQARMQE